MKIRAQEYANFFQNSNAQIKKEQYADFFDDHSSFEDPFQKVQGLDAVYKVFAHMYETLHKPNFFIEEIVAHESVAYIRWSFFYQLSQNTEIKSFEGVSPVVFRDDGKVHSHIDYWDAAQNVYEKVPILGAILRFIKRRARA